MEPSTELHIRFGQPSDNTALLELASLTPMAGRISFRTDRQPDFFRLLKNRGTFVLLVAEWDGKLVGSVSASEMKVFVDGLPASCHYIGDLKVHPDYRGKGVALAMAKALSLELGKMGADHLLSAVLAGNHAPGRFLTENPWWPVPRPTGSFLVRQMLPKPTRKSTNPFTVQESEWDDAVVSLLNAFMKQFRFGKVFTRQQPSRVLTATLDGRLVAALALVDVETSKQDVVTNMPLLLEKSLRLLFSGNRLPKRNQPVKALYIRAFACAPGEDQALVPLIRYARDLAFREGYHFLTIGLHERNPWNRVFRKFTAFKLNSNLYVAGTETNDEVPWLDYSLV